VRARVTLSRMSDAVAVQMKGFGFLLCCVDGSCRIAAIWLEDLVRWLQPIVRGWVDYYGRFCPSALYRELRMIDELVVRWAQRKYQLRKRHAAWDWLKRLRSRQPALLPHWQLAAAVGR